MGWKCPPPLWLWRLCPMCEAAFPTSQSRQVSQHPGAWDQPPPLPTTPRNSSHRLLFLPLLGRSQGDSFTCTCECECGRERLGMHGCRRARVSVDMRVQECTCGHSLSVSSPGHPPPSSQGAHPLPPAHRAAWWQNWPWSSSPRHPDLSRGTSVAVLFCMFAGTSSCSPHSPPGQERDALVSTL